jgi:hypothetical protein
MRTTYAYTSTTEMRARWSAAVKRLHQCKQALVQVTSFASPQLTLESAVRVANAKMVAFEKHWHNTADVSAPPLQSSVRTMLEHAKHSMKWLAKEDATLPALLSEHERARATVEKEYALLLDRDEEAQGAPSRFVFWCVCVCVSMYR